LGGEDRARSAKAGGPDSERAAPARALQWRNDEDAQGSGFRGVSEWERGEEKEGRWLR